MGLTPAQVTEAMAPLRAQIDQYALIPTKVIEPKTNLYDTIEFVPELLLKNIERGREAVRSDWPNIASFLGIPESLLLHHLFRTRIVAVASLAAQHAFEPLNHRLRRLARNGIHL